MYGADGLLHAVVVVPHRAHGRRPGLDHGQLKAGGEHRLRAVLVPQR